MQDEELLIPIIGIVMGCSIAIVGIITSHWSKVEKRKRVEESRREIAAYIAEGSMTPQDGERLMNAGPDIGKEA